MWTLAPPVGLLLVIGCARLAAANEFRVSIENVGSAGGLGIENGPGDLAQAELHEVHFRNNLGLNQKFTHGGPYDNFYLIHGNTTNPGPPLKALVKVSRGEDGRQNPFSLHVRNLGSAEDNAQPIELMHPGLAKSVFGRQTYVQIDPGKLGHDVSQKEFVVRYEGRDCFKVTVWSSESGTPGEL